MWELNGVLYAYHRLPKLYWNCEMLLILCPIQCNSQTLGIQYFLVSCHEHDRQSLAPPMYYYNFDRCWTCQRGCGLLATVTRVLITALKPRKDMSTHLTEFCGLTLVPTCKGSNGPTRRTVCKLTCDINYLTLIHEGYTPDALDNRGMAISTLD